MTAIVGEAGLSEPDRRALDFADRFERRLIHQGTDRRNLAETVELGWDLLRPLPRADLTRLSEAAWSTHVRVRS
jgi:V/A-type H+-transporting ATPase subunit B